MRRVSLVVLSLGVFLTACNDGGIAGGDNEPPVAEAGDNVTVLVNQQVDFDGSGSYDPDGTIINYEWDFGDGATDVGLQANHSWDTPGEYTVTLTVTDNKGAKGTDSPTITIDVEPYPGVYTAVPSPSQQPCDTILGPQNVSFVATDVDISINGTTMSSDWHVENFGLNVIEASTGPISGDSFVQDSVYEQVTSTMVDTDFDGIPDTTITIVTTYTNSWVGSFNGDGTLTSDLIQNIVDDQGILNCSLTWGIEGTKVSELP